MTTKSDTVRAFLAYAMNEDGRFTRENLLERVARWEASVLDASIPIPDSIAPTERAARIVASAAQHTNHHVLRQLIEELAGLVHDQAPEVWKGSFPKHGEPPRVLTDEEIEVLRAQSRVGAHLAWWDVLSLIATLEAHPRLTSAELTELCQALDALSQWEIHENDETDPARLERIAALKAKLSGSW